MATHTSLHGTKYIWRLPIADKQIVTDLALTYNLSFPVVETLVQRGYASQLDFEQFLFTQRETVVADAALLKDAQKAVDRIKLALAHKEKILIAGDYDVDGITATALMLICLMPLGAQVNFFLPNRVRDGYGLSVKTVERAAKSGYSVVITVDNGITAFDAALTAKAYGIDLIITDHHRAHDAVPEAYAIVNPNQPGCAYPFKALAGVGVAFKIMSLLYAELQQELPQAVYELLLLGTVADVVPLVGENRFWVRQGLLQVNAHESLAFKVLKKNARFCKPQLSSLDIGFGLTPQLNALGRLDDPRDGVKFLVGSDGAETERVGTVLREFNEARRAVERSILVDIEERIAKGTLNPEKDLLLIAASKDWPAGVIGLAASRLVSQYGRPVILLHLTAEGIAKGSARSIPEFNMFDAFTECKDILLQFGGHSVAAGLSLPQEQIPELKRRIEERMRAMLTEEDLQQKIILDAELRLPDVGKKLLSDLAYLEPFGCANSKPLFYVRGVTLVEQPTLLKEQHVKCTVFAEGVIKPVVFFYRPDLYERLIRQGKEPFSVAVEVSENHWQGRVTVEFIGLDVAELLA